MGRNYPAKDYSNTPRKVFDKHVDQIKIAQQRARDVCRADLEFCLKQIRQLTDQVNELKDHVAQHCLRISPTHDGEGVDSLT